MKWICYDCNWTGSQEDLFCDGLYDACPNCNSDNVDVDDREPDPLDDENQTFRNVEVSALINEWNI